MLLVVAVLLAGIILIRHFAPSSNTSRQHFDVLVILGTPADSDGNPTPEQLSHVTEGVREYERGVASHILLTGGAVRNRFVEAESMARTARSMGVPDSAILIEPQARNTIQNASYSYALMRQHGWNSAEIISGSVHLPRAALIFDRLPIEWRIHAVPLLYHQSVWSRRKSLELEYLKISYYLLWSRWTQPVLP